MPFYSLPESLRNIHWSYVGIRKEQLIYESSDEETIDDFRTRWILSSPLSASVVFLSSFPSEAERIHFQRKEQSAFIRTGNAFYFWAHDKTNALLITNDPNSIKKIDQYIQDAHFFDSNDSVSRLSIADLATFYTLTAFDVFQYKKETSFNALYAPKRLVNIWKKIQPHFPVYLFTDAWLSPSVIGSVVQKETLSKVFLSYYKNHRFICMDPFESNLICSVHGHYFCNDVSLLLKKGNELDNYYLQKFKDPHSNRSILLRQYLQDDTHPQHQTRAQYLNAMIYLEEQLPPQQIMDCHISDNMFKKLSIFREHHHTLSIEIMPLLISIVTDENDNHEKSTSAANTALVTQLTTGVLLNKLMYLVVNNPLYVYHFFSSISPQQLKADIMLRNVDGMNALDLAHIHSRTTLANIIPHLLFLSEDEQGQLLIAVNDGQYKNLFHFAAYEYPEVFYEINKNRHGLNIWEPWIATLHMNNAILNTFSLNPLIESIKQELSEHLKTTPIHAELNQLYKTLLKIKYHFMFPKSSEDKYKTLRKQMHIVFAVADKELIEKYYYWNRYGFIPTLFKPKNEFYANYIEFKEVLARLALDDIQVREDEDGCVLVFI